MTKITRCPPAYAAPVQGGEPIPEMRDRAEPRRVRNWGHGVPKTPRSGIRVTNRRAAVLREIMGEGE